MIKVPLLVALYDAAARGEVDLDGRLAIPASAIQSDVDDLAGRLRPDETVTLRELAHLLVSRSDNTARVTIQELIGGAERVNEWLADNGFAVTRNNSRTPARREHHQRWGWGMTTPREIAELLVRIREGRAVSPVMDEAMYRLLTGSYWTGEALSVLPPRVQVASKQGAVSRSRSEVLLVHAPTGECVLAVITKNQADTSWDEDNAGYELIRAVSAAVYRHYNPGDPWRPADRAAFPRS